MSEHPNFSDEKLKAQKTLIKCPISLAEKVK